MPTRPVTKLILLFGLFLPLVENAIAEAFVGFFLAPMCPTAMQLRGALLPREPLARSIV
jgi:hypothetical protein